MDLAPLAAGDWIFRLTQSVPGFLSRHLDPVGDFSHVGIACPGPFGWEVVHAMPAEGNLAGGVRAESLASFCCTTEVLAVAQARLGTVTRSQGLAMAAAARSFLGRPFDERFDSTDDTALYCTELVWRVTESAGVRLDKPVQRLRTPIGDVSVVSLATLARQPGLVWVQRFG